jgi:hypothetical protein
MAKKLAWGNANYSANHIKQRAYVTNNGFTVKQACLSGKALAKNWSNRPTDEELTRLKETLRVVNDIVKEFENKYGDYGVWIESGYRSECVNKAVGGVPNSGHRGGGAVDLKVYRKSDTKYTNTVLVKVNAGEEKNPIEYLMQIAANYLKDKNLEWDEFLREFKKGGYWFHLAMTSREGKKRKKACNIARSGDPVDGQKLDRQYGMCGLTINRG